MQWRRLIASVVWGLVLAGCANAQQAAPEPVVVTVTADPSPVTTVTENAPPPSSPERAAQGTPGGNASTEVAGAAEESLPYGLVIAWATDMCTTPTDSIPDLVTAASDENFTYVIQVMTLEYGYDPGPIDGQYGPQTIAAVKQLQSHLSVVPDGQVGPITWGALKADYCPGFFEHNAGYGGGGSGSSGGSGTGSGGGSGGSGGYNPAPAPAPTSNDPGPTPTSVPKNGTCPSGYVANFDRCDPLPGGPHAVPKEGNFCPGGYRQDWNYCVRI